MDDFCSRMRECPDGEVPNRVGQHVRDSMFYDWI
jgi:hypothetical protein